MKAPLAAALLSLSLAALPAARPASAQGEAAHETLNYEAYSLGLPIALLDTELDLTSRGYAFRLHYRTEGVAALVVSGDQTGVARGVWAGSAPRPELFTVDGTSHGKPSHIRIAYADGTPQVQRLDPPNDDREAVPDARQAGTADTLSVMVQLVRRIAMTGRCDGSAEAFDGRRLFRLTVRTAGDEVLEPTGRSSFSGKALRCDFSGVLEGGFMNDAGASAHKPRAGSAWFAPVEPGGPALPVRARFDTPWITDVTMYLVK